MTTQKRPTLGSTLLNAQDKFSQHVSAHPERSASHQEVNHQSCTRCFMMIYSFYWQNNRSTYRNSTTVNV